MATMTSIKHLLAFSLVLPALLLGSTGLWADEPSAGQATVILIIDDIGNNSSLGQRAVALPGPINYAVLPHSPNGSMLAKAAHQQGKEVLLHIPMSNLHGQAVGPGALTPVMNRQQFLLTFQQDLDSVPHARGVNNHMGSLLTQLQQPMGWLMAELKRRQLYFVDSRTSPRTVAQSQADKHKIPALRRDIFLDNQRNEAAISQQFERLISLAQSQGIAVAIGHPYPETLDFLQHALPGLALRGVKMALISEVLKDQRCGQPNQRLLVTASDCPKTASLAPGIGEAARQNPPLNPKANKSTKAEPRAPDEDEIKRGAAPDD